MTEKKTEEKKEAVAPVAPAVVEEPQIDAAELEDHGPQIPPPHERPADIDRRIGSAVDTMLQDEVNPYEIVIVAAQEARRINHRRLKARSILNQALESVEEVVPDVPFVPRPVEDEEPEVKATNDALERLALGLVEYDVADERKTSTSYYGGEIDFDLYAHRSEGDEDEA